MLRLQRPPTHVLPFDHSFPPAPALGVCIFAFSTIGLWQSVPPARVTYMLARVAHMFSGLEKRSLSAIFFGRVRMDYAPLGERSALSVTGRKAAWRKFGSIMVNDAHGNRSSQVGVYPLIMTFRTQRNRLLSSINGQLPDPSHLLSQRRRTLGRTEARRESCLRNRRHGRAEFR